MSSTALRRSLAGGGVLVALSSATALAMSSRRIAAEQTAHRAPAAGRCVPGTLNRSAVLPGTSLAVSPLPGSYDALPSTQISLLGAPPGALSAVSARGSRSGWHPGRLRAYSQGDGASFVPARPFRPGEAVTVRGRVRSGAGIRPFAYGFVVARPDPVPYSPSAHTFHPRDYPEVQHFRTQPGLLAPVVVVSARSPATAPGYLFAAPYSGPGPSGPMIFDEAGNLVWFLPLPSGTEATNLQVQRYYGQPVLTWWQGRIPRQGFGEGEEVIANGSYRQIGRVRAGNGARADLHDFHLTPQDTALMTVFNPIRCNVSAVGGPRGGAVTDSVLQEIDLKSGLVRREWHSLDHVPLSASYNSPVTTSAQWPFDFFHIDSIDQLPDGTTLISARNTWALYRLSSSTGQVLTRVGGRTSDVKLARGAATAFQHDAELQANGQTTMFDNGGVPKIHSQSRALVVSIDEQAKTDTMVAQYFHPTPLLAGSQGNAQVLANGDTFVGWGAAPYFSEFSPAGQLLFDAHMHGSYQSYRGYRFPWAGAGAGAPSVAAARSSRQGPVIVYASWNGDTRTASWRVLAGASPTQLAPVAGAARAGFETAIATPGPERYVAVQALDASGGLLGVSRTIAG